jgi:hypothetical protein
VAESQLSAGLSLLRKGDCKSLGLALDHAPRAITREARPVANEAQAMLAAVQMVIEGFDTAI